ncbi:MAG TPA: hypothetical protein ENO20_07305 [Bacteroides sp.]|nr:hypothetical protein [Bacteroides sp.]
MDYFNLAVWVTVIMTIAAIVIHFYYRNKLRTESKLSVLKSFAEENDSTIILHDSWDQTHIGIDDRETMKLFFIRSTVNKDTREVINLTEAERCHLGKEVRTVTQHREKILVIDKIGLIISFRDMKKPAARLEFYNNDYDPLTLSGELQMAEKWEKIINDTISNYRKKDLADKKLKVTGYGKKVV